jgi:carboxymethylenebutenolidase
MKLFPIVTSEVTVGVDGSAMALRIAAPAARGPHPAALVCHHREGVDDFTRYVLMRLAEIGIVAVAPNFYHRRPAAEDPIASTKHLDDRELIADLRATLRQMQAVPEIRRDRIGTVGHCLGGRTSFLALVHEPVFTAAVLLYHGNIFESRGAGLPAPIELAPKICCPILGLFGMEDHNPSPEAVARLGEELTRHGIRHEFHGYDGAGHAFQDFHAAKHYRQAASDDAWTRLLDFLQRELL